MKKSQKLVKKSEKNRQTVKKKSQTYVKSSQTTVTKIETCKKTCHKLMSKVTNYCKRDTNLWKKSHKK